MALSDGVGKMNKRASSFNIYDVASRAGVSKSTVSRVLNSSSQVKDSTRLRVQEAMEELGYNPNATARRLAGSTDRRIGLVLPFFTEMFSSFYVHEVLRGVGEVASERDAELLVHIQHNGNGSNGVERKLNGNGFHGGWIVADESIPIQALESLQQEGVPVVLLNREAASLRVPAAVVDNRLGAYRAAEYLLGLGHRRIATVTGDLDQQPGRDRLAGFEDALAAHQVRLPEDHVIRCNFDREAAAAGAAKLLRSGLPPTAIFAASDLMAAGVYEAAAAAGFRVPDDLSVVGFDDDTMAAQMSPKLTTIRQPLREIARSASEWLLTRLDAGDMSSFHVVLAPELVIRGSCCPPYNWSRRPLS